LALLVIEVAQKWLHFTQGISAVTASIGVSRRHTLKLRSWCVRSRAVLDLLNSRLLFLTFYGGSFKTNSYHFVSRSTVTVSNGVGEEVR